MILELIQGFYTDTQKAEINILIKSETKWTYGIFKITNMFLYSSADLLNVGFNIIFDEYCDLRNLLSEVMIDYTKFSI